MYCQLPPCIFQVLILTLKKELFYWRSIYSTLSICLVLCYAFPYLFCLITTYFSPPRCVKVITVLVFWGLNPGNATWQVRWPGLVRLCYNHRPAQVSEFVDSTGLVLSLEKPSRRALPWEGAEWASLPSLIAPPGLTVLLQLLLLGKEHWESLLGQAVTWKGKGPLLPTAHVQERLEVSAQWS